MSGGVGHRHGLDLVLLWLWHCLAAAATLIRPLTWELPYATGVALKKKKNLQKQKQKKPTLRKESKMEKEKNMK